MERRRGWIFFRYLFPLICAVLIFAALCVPCLQYTNNQSGTDEPISAMSLMKNSWDQVRNYLFGTGEQTNGNMQFSQTVLVLLILFWLLFALGVAAAVWAWLAFLRYAEEGRENETGRVWFITLIPNRIVLCVLCALMLPVACFPHVVIWLYRSIYVAVELKVYVLDPMWLALALYAALILLSSVSAGYEKSLRMDLFRKPKERKGETEETDFDEREGSEEKTDGLSSAQENAQRAQAERIARLLREGRLHNDNEHKD